MATHAQSMEPLSARIPGELYLWLAQLQVEGATTNSDKLRVLLGQLKRQHDGAFDYLAAHAWARDLTGRLRDALVKVEAQTNRHSEVLNMLLEHTATALAMLVSQAPADEPAAARLEESLVRRAFSLCEALLRQGLTPGAAAFDPTVIRRHVGATLDLATAVAGAKGAGDG